MAETTHRIRSGRAQLSAEVAGQGDPVVFLHAAVFDRTMWRAQVDAVAATHLAIAYDRRSFGGTVAEPEDHSPVADLLAIIDALAPGQPATLVACSQGGRIALDFALAHPSRTRALVLIAPSISGAPEPVLSPPITALVAEAAAAEAARNWDRVSALKAQLWLDGPLQREGRISGELRRMFLQKNTAALLAQPVGASLDTAPAFPRLGEISAPALVISGDLDFPHIQERSRLIATMMPHASGAAIAETAHLPSLERPDEVTRLIAGFLARL
ncbi:alpha/beta hydrolase [Bradyrhizobium sp. SSBR45G]|uniref:alpha/beta fold hydrolase n=1 Tax=unclassified Bradyrhizobium TaxID=2631580 RepID=UPI002342B5F5|nr:MULTISPECIES: alpha/beta hydrolase [unclassified Bradyrhizobium]GLH75927.1 alpha/beta hydrolase [Bradyrhizobium sp. SSBR45G]GLH85164.1 alpha/beta hydrolase [Bradyrhizobium sp. SSBR45R]